jgi:hypothetical protein
MAGGTIVSMDPAVGDLVRGDLLIEGSSTMVSRRAIAQCMLYLAGLIHLRGKDGAMADEKTEQFHSDRLVLPSKRELNLRDLADKEKSLRPEGKKLPPEPGRTPRASSVPAGGVASGIAISARRTQPRPVAANATVVG